MLWESKVNSVLPPPPQTSATRAPPPYRGRMSPGESSSESEHSFFQNEILFGFVKQLLLRCKGRRYFERVLNQQQLGTFVPCMLGEELQMNSRCGSENHSKASASGKIHSAWEHFPEDWTCVQSLLFKVCSFCLGICSQWDTWLLCQCLPILESKKIKQKGNFKGKQSFG